MCPATTAGVEVIPADPALHPPDGYYIMLERAPNDFAATADNHGPWAAYRDDKLPNARSGPARNPTWSGCVASL